MYSRVEPERLQYAESLVNRYGERTFSTNADHYAPDYVHLLQVGLPGIIEEINISMEAHETDIKKYEFLI